MAHNEAIIDIANALMQLERAFLKHDMHPPDMLRWSDIREAKRNMTILRSEAVKAPWSGGGVF